MLKEVGGLSSYLALAAWGILAQRLALYQVVENSLLTGHPTSERRLMYVLMSSLH